MILTKDYIYRLYHSFKRKATKAFNHGRCDVSLKYLEAACDVAYKFYIGFTDNQIEATLKQLAMRIQKCEALELGPRCVFYDTFSQDAQGLTMQYVDAIIAAGWEMLYITEFGLDDPRSVRLKQTLQDYPKVTIVSIPRQARGMKKVQFIYDTIVKYAPDKLFMHIHPSAVEAVAAFYALPNEIIKYLINLTDHTYWVGAGCVDYTFEFREYGASLSVGRRGIQRDHVLLLPYYPMMKATKFNGFPNEAEGKVKLFSGGSFYKIIDENDTFFKLNKAILDANPNAVTLFAGSGDSAMLNGLIEKYALKGRFVAIGQRNDIYECYKHADIYLSTYPLAGGLMSQFAAHAGLPILALANNNSSGRIEEFVCQKQSETITSPNVDDLVSEATRLINDDNYRRLRGQAMRDCVVGAEEFNRSFQNSVSSGRTQYPISIDEEIKLHYLNINDKLKLENSTKAYHRSVFSTLGLLGLFTCPRVWFGGAIARIKSSRMGIMFKH